MMLEAIKSFLRPTSSSSVPKVNKFDPVDHVFRQRLCPCCDSYDSLLSGPTGGMSVNVMCAECGTRLNLTPMIGLVGWTHGPQPVIWNGKQAVKDPAPEKVAARRAAIEAL
mgnify:CR=1 FL=1